MSCSSHKSPTRCSQERPSVHAQLLPFIAEILVALHLRLIKAIIEYPLYCFYLVPWAYFVKPNVLKYR